MDHNLQNVKISFVSPSEDYAYDLSKSFRHYIEDQDFADNIEIKQERNELKNDEAGGDVLAMLSLFIGSPLLGEFAKAFSSWLQSKFNDNSKKTSEITIEFETGDGRKIKIATKDGGDYQKIFDSLKELINE